MGKLILLVDDDRLPMQFYIKALQLKGYEVKHCLDTDSALDFVKEKKEQIHAIILDIMMLPGNVYKDEDTNEGLRTGVFLFGDIRKHCPKVPIVVLTNVKNPKTLVEFKDKAFIEVLQKIDYTPFELVRLIDKMLKDVH